VRRSTLVYTGRVKLDHHSVHQSPGWSIFYPHQGARLFQQRRRRIWTVGGGR